MAELNGMSMEDLVKFAEQGVLPDGEFADDGSSSSESDGDFDLNDLSPEALLAMAQGEDVVVKKAPDEPEEASEDDLRALLADTLSEDELGGDAGHEDVAKNIDKLKLRKLANRLEEMAPSKMFPPRKDEIYYFLSSMAGQSQKLRIEEADAKCRFIGVALAELETYMISEASFEMEEQEALVELFKDFSSETVLETNTRNLVLEQFKFGWRQVLKRLTRDITNLKEHAQKTEKPIWIIYTFYESLSRAYGLCKAHESLKEYQEELSTEMTKEDKRDIVTSFEDVIELAPYYGLKSIDFINRKQAYDALDKLDLPAILEVLKKKRGH